MEERKNNKTNLSEVEIAYNVLKGSGQAKNFRELMQQVFDSKGMTAENPQLMAAIHTQINLDNRFVFLGQGSWGLKEWTQGKVVRRSVPASAAGRSVPVRRRSLQDELEYEDAEFNESYDNTSADEDDGWEE